MSEQTIPTDGRARAEIINAIADLALAARAGTLLRAYEREWAWTDQQNYRDLVDADTFNGTFHAIEREFDKLAAVLAQGSGPSLEPDWEQTVTLPAGTEFVELSHGLDGVDLLVDVQAQIPRNMRSDIAVAGSAEVMWTNVGVGVLYGFVLTTPSTLTLMRWTNIELPYASVFSGQLTLRVRAWRVG